MPPKEKLRGGMKLNQMTASSGAAKPTSRKSMTGMADLVPGESAMASVRHQDGVGASQPIDHLVVELAGEGLLAELLDHEDAVADAHLILDARAQRIFVVEAALTRRCRLRPATSRKRRNSGRITRWPSREARRDLAAA